MKRVPTQDCLRKSFNTHLRKMLTRRLRPKQNSLRDFSTVPFLYKPNHLQKKRGSYGQRHPHLPAPDRWTNSIERPISSFKFLLQNSMELNRNMFHTWPHLQHLIGSWQWQHRRRGTGQRSTVLTKIRTDLNKPHPPLNRHQVFLMPGFVGQEPTLVPIGREAPHARRQHTILVSAGRKPANGVVQPGLGVINRSRSEAYIVNQKRCRALKQTSLDHIQLVQKIVSTVFRQRI